MLHVLVVEDDPNIAGLISLTLQAPEYRCVCCHDGEMAADMLEEKDYDLVLLDVMLPGYDGFTLMEYIGPLGMPVIFLTAKAALKDRVKGLKLGADDYMVKPFEPEELLARVEAVLRRAGKGVDEVAIYDAVIHLPSRRVLQKGRPVPLTHHEYDLLLMLVRNRGVALYRDALFEEVWGEESPEGSRTLDLHIMRLRQKLGWQGRIKTVYKVGYMLEKES